jgi:hypothetical protein
MEEGALSLLTKEIKNSAENVSETAGSSKEIENSAENVSEIAKNSIGS